MSTRHVVSLVLAARRCAGTPGAVCRSGPAHLYARDDRRFASLQVGPLGRPKKTQHETALPEVSLATENSLTLTQQAI